MIRLTSGAVALITIVVGQRSDASDGGLRITAVDGSLDLTFVPHREPGDEVVEQAGARVFLDAPAAQQLDGKTLDGRVTDAGAPAFDVIEPTV